MKWNMLFIALVMSVTAALAFQLPDSRNDAPDIDPVHTVTLEPVGNELKFATTEIKAKAGSTLKIEFVNTSSLMPHTVAFLKAAEDIEPVGAAALEAAEYDYIPQGYLDRIIAATKVAQPGETVTIEFIVPPPGSYPYICTYPGHFSVMQGVLISEE